MCYICGSIDLSESYNYEWRELIRKEEIIWICNKCQKIKPILLEIQNIQSSFDYITNSNKKIVEEYIKDNIKISDIKQIIFIKHMLHSQADELVKYIKNNLTELTLERMEQEIEFIKAKSKKIITFSCLQKITGRSIGFIKNRIGKKSMEYSESNFEYLIRILAI